MDHATGYTRVFHQVSLSASETIRSKEHFEQDLRKQSCIKVKAYHTDDGIFKSAKFNKHLHDQSQHITFSGVGAKHQNGVAERAIKTITWLARAMMIHSNLHWPEHFSIDLWPFAMDYAVWLHNYLPDCDLGLAPMSSTMLLSCLGVPGLRA